MYAFSSRVVRRRRLRQAEILKSHLLIKINIWICDNTDVLESLAGTSQTAAPKDTANSVRAEDYFITVSSPARLHGRKGWRIVRIQAASGACVSLSSEPAAAGDAPKNFSSPPSLSAIHTKTPANRTRSQVQKVQMRVSVTGTEQQIREARVLIDQELALEAIRDQMQVRYSINVEKGGLLFCS